MDTPRDTTGARVGVARSARRFPQRAAGAVVVVALLYACKSLWPTITDQAVAPSAVVLGCAATAAREMGYKVVVDSGHGQVTADKNLPLSRNGPDPTEYSRKDELAITTKRGPSGGTTLTIIPKSIAVTNTRRGYTDVAQPSTPAVVADADTIRARCRSAAPNTSLPQ